ncbi:prepilin peptidase [Micromonospora olivasterospora]|uniref:Leader peptidase (Prepilin peptidase)/N-methyltransferase n=1 Tax=Micromonospora olivasterospora TaxID=1880 RepID=A0A562I950_MICOL|nr:prepilin peptidase [Micromonospora olivasterospora]TWH67422.1 leader peptidase (prepilin peptidase)/N-methyltransferase [Micromonospora olivasterospora]
MPAGPLILVASAGPLADLAAHPWLPAVGALGGAAGAAVPWLARRFTPGDRHLPAARVTAVAGAVVFAGLGVAPGAGPALPAFLAVAAIGLVLAVVDLACLRLPDRLVGAAALAAVVGLGAAAGIAGRPDRLLAPLAGAALSFAGYSLLALLPGSRLGFGDVKLAAVLGLPLGWLGWPTLLAGLALPHVLHGLAVLALLAARRVRRDTLLPLGPALLAGAWLAALLA